MRVLSFGEAIREAIFEEMERDPRVFLYGLGVTDHKAIFGSTDGILKKFGELRCFETPLSEDAMTGFGLGAAINGLRPIHVHIRADFLMLAMNQIVNMISSYHYMTAGQLNVPLVIRAIIGRGWGQSFQHSKSLHSFFAHVPGLKVVMPTSPSDAKGLLISAIRDPNPVIFFEHRWLYYISDDVPKNLSPIPLGKASVLKPGKDVTLIATSWMNIEALKAAEILERHGVSVEVVDPRTISPLDEETLIQSVKKTRVCMIADYDWLNCGFSAEIAARLSEKCFSDLKMPIQRFGFEPTPCPCSRPLENRFYPTAKDFIRHIEKALGLSHIDVSQEVFYNYEHRFRGPF